MLRHHKTGVEPCSTRRFQQEADKAGGPNYILGYSREDWSRALFTTATFMHMHKPKIRSGRGDRPGLGQDTSRLGPP